MVAQLHPALKLSMGTWEYYSVKMSMKDLVANVTFNMRSILQRH